MTTMSRQVLLMLVGLACTTADAEAQRLRVTAGGRSETGTYQSLTDSTLVIVAKTPTTISLTAIDLLEYSRGRRASTVGSIAGFFVGALAGSLVGCATNRDDYGVFCGGQNDSKVVTGAAIGGAVGIGLAGALLKREQWRAIDLSELRRIIR